MKKFIPLIADALLAGVCVFLLFFTLVRYYFSTAAGLAAGITAGLAAGAGTFFYIRAKQKKTLELSACKAGAGKRRTRRAYCRLCRREGRRKLCRKRRQAVLCLLYAGTGKP